MDQSFNVAEWHYIGTQVANAGTQTVPTIDESASVLPNDSNSLHGGMATTGMLADKAGLAVVIGAGILGMSAGAHLMKRRLHTNESLTPRVDSGFISNVGFLAYAPLNMASCTPLVVQFHMWKKVDLGGFRSLVSQLSGCPKSQVPSEDAGRNRSAPPPTEKTPLEVHPGMLDPLVGSFLLGASLTALAAALLLGRVRRINHNILTASSSSVAPPRVAFPVKEGISDVGVASVTSGDANIVSEQARIGAPLITEDFATDTPLLSKSTDVQAALMESMAAKKDVSTKGLAGSQVTFSSPLHMECSRSVLTEISAKQLPAVDVEFSVMANMPAGLKPQIGEDTGAYVHGGVVRPRPRTSSKLFRIVPS